MTTYRVEKDGKTVWSGKSDAYDRDAIPAEYRARPESGEVRLFVDDALIGVQIALSDELLQLAAALKAEGK